MQPRQRSWFFASEQAVTAPPTSNIPPRVMGEETFLPFPREAGALEGWEEQRKQSPFACWV